MFPRLRLTLAALFAATLLVPSFLVPSFLVAQSPTPADTLLHATEAAKLLPSAVFFKGQSAPIQGRNSGGVKFADGAYVLAALVDNSGYSTAVQQKYQAYLIAETPVQLNGHPLAPGAYGVGFVQGHFGVMDIGGHDLFSVDAARDADLKRPTPLQVIAGDKPGEFRLYQGRDYVVLSRAPAPM
jgi:hypothetical protein